MRNMELVKIIAWIPKVWHHLNRFLEAHSSSDVTIGRGRAGGQAGAGTAALGALAFLDGWPWALAAGRCTSHTDREGAIV